MPHGDDKRSKRTDAVRAAVDQAFSVTAGQAQVTRNRAGVIADEIAEELSSAAGRVRGAIDDLRPSAGEELEALRERVTALEAKVAALQTAPQSTTGAPPRKRRATPPAKRTP